MKCIQCEHELWEFANWEDYDTNITCPMCGKIQLVCGDECYIEEINEVDEWFWTEEPKQESI
jgi:DNA-directed RNA polymerase subunit RPC12/RpoP